VKRKQKKTVQHFGELHRDSLLNVIPQDLVIPERASGKNDLSFGWAISDSPPRQLIQFKDILYATAEAAVCLAVITESVRHSKTPDALEIQFGDGTVEWARSLRLDQVITGDWAAPKSDWTEVRGCYACPVARFLMRAEADVTHITDWVIGAVQKLPQNVLISRSHEMHDLLLCMRRVVSEAVLNIWQHAYPSKPIKPVYICLTVSPPRHYTESHNNKFLKTPKQPVSWLEENKNGLVFEIAIGDHGLGIPKTLWRNCQSRGLTITREKCWISPDPIDRARCHQEICKYAFDHQSTSKQDKDFPNRTARLNWRGWHRGMRLTSHVGGCIYVSSGRGIAGYAYIGGRIQQLNYGQSSSIELPGTIAVLRFSTQPKHATKVLTASSGDKATIRISQTILEEHLKLPQQANRNIVGFAEPPRSLSAVAITFSFRAIEEEGELFQLVEACPPNHVLLLLFTKIDETLLNLLRTSETAYDDVKHGLPRLICIPSPDRANLSWKIAGVLPVTAEADRVYSDLEEYGFADLSKEKEPVWNLAREFARNYPSFIEILETEKRIQFIHFSCELDQADVSDSLQKTFAAVWEKELQKIAVFLPSSKKVIRLPSGRYVARAISVLHMLWSKPLLVEALRVKLREIINHFGRPQEICIIADGPASYFVACLLLRGQTDVPRILIYGHRMVDLKLFKIILFVDLLSRSQTVIKVMNELQARSYEISRVVACMDIRVGVFDQLVDNNPTASPLIAPDTLIRMKFDPQPLTETPDPLNVVEWDAITHAPVHTTSEFNTLGFDQSINQFLSDHPELFRHGFHVVANRLHTISLDTRAMVINHKDKVIAWLGATAINLIRTLPKIDFSEVVFYCRSESCVFSVLDGFANAIAKEFPIVSRVSCSTLHAAPTSPKSLFPREEENIMKDLSILLDLRHPELFPRDEKRRKFLGVYLDDAAITGNTLFDSISKIVRLSSPHPSGILALLLVNRLNPRETRLLSSCRSLSSHPISQAHHHTEAMVPFRFGYVSRLQVRSLEEFASTSAAKKIAKMNLACQHCGKDIQSYLENIQEKLNKITHSSDIVAHIYHPDIKVACPITSRAARLRHLLALSAQNEGVMVDILTELQEIKRHRDYSFLSVLALEPDILESDPLPYEGWDTIQDLCVSALGSDCLPSLKSDALAVLAFVPSGHPIEKVDAILAPILQDQKLAVQFTAQFRTFCAHDRNLFSKILASLDSISDPGIKPFAEKVCDLLRATETIYQTYTINNTATAFSLLHKLIAETGWHVGISDWKVFNQWIKRLRDNQVVSFDPQIKTIAISCLELAEKTLIPGIAALNHIAKERQDYGAVHTLEEARFQSVIACSSIRAAIETSVAVAKLKETWHQLTHATLVGTPPDSFLARHNVVSDDPSVLETVMPKFFSSPYWLFRQVHHRLLNAYGGCLKNLILEVDASAYENQNIVIPYARTVLYDVFYLLLDNVAQHGVIPGAKVCFSLIRDGNEWQVVVTIIDQERPNDEPGLHGGMNYIRKASRQEKFEVEESHPKQNGEPYEVKLTFRNAIVIQPQIRRR
jgi:hypothetical protein